MKRLWSIVLPLIASLGVHALLAAGLVAYLAWCAAPKTLVTLDVSSVELSFAEQETDVAAAQAVPIADATPTRPRPQPKTEAPPELTDPLSQRPHEPTDATPEPPEPTVRPMETPEIPRPAVAATSAPPTPAPRQGKVDAPPRPKRSIRPDYPKAARQRGEQGDVNVEIEVDAEGCVARARIVESCGFSELDAAALKAVREARFMPAKSGGRAVAATARLTLEFKLK